MKKVKDMEKLLSIIIPSYNVESTLGTTSDSLINSRNLEKLEIIIVNDGSTDKTIDIAGTYKEKAPDSIIVVDKQNGGHGSTINAGIAVSSGKYGFILDGDDWVDTDVLDRIIKTLEEDKIDIVICDYITINVATKEKKIAKVIPTEKGARFNIEQINRLNCYLPMASIIVKRDVLLKIPSISENTFYVDEEYCTYVVSLSNTFLYLGEVLYYYRIGTTSQSMNISNQIKKFNHKIRVLDKLIDYYRDCIDGESKKYIYKKIVGMIKNLYEISLLADTDRKRGKKNASVIRGKADCIKEVELSTRNYYYLMGFLHLFHVGYEKYRNLISKVKKIK